MASGDALVKQIHLEEIDSASSESVLVHARSLLLEYGRFVLAQPGAARFCFGTLENEAAGLPLSFINQGGGSLIAFVDREPSGLVAWRALPAAIAPNACELKRLWVRPSGRGLSIGRTLTLTALDRARAAGFQSAFLDTAPPVMVAAHRLYLELGFEPCAPYNDNPVKGIVHLVKNL